MKDAYLAKIQQLEHELDRLKKNIQQIPSRFPIGAPSDGTSIREKISATNSFLPGDVVYLNGGTWTKARANAIATSLYSGIIESATTNGFVIVYAGKITLTGLSAGTTYYLSDVTAGATIARTALGADAMYVPVMRAVTDKIAIVLPERDLLADHSALTLGDNTDGGGALTIFYAAGKKITIEKTTGKITATFPNNKALVIEQNKITMNFTNGNSLVAEETKLTMSFTNGNKFEVAQTDFIGSGKLVKLREVDVCEGTTAKKMLIASSQTY